MAEAWKPSGYVCYYVGSPLKRSLKTSAVNIANFPPLSREGIRQLDIGDNARTINEQGGTIVPLDVRKLGNGEVYVRAKDLTTRIQVPRKHTTFSRCNL